VLSDLPSSAQSHPDMQARLQHPTQPAQPSQMQAAPASHRSKSAAVRAELSSIARASSHSSRGRPSRVETYAPASRRGHRGRWWSPSARSESAACRWAQAQQELWRRSVAAWGTFCAAAAGDGATRAPALGAGGSRSKRRPSIVDCPEGCPCHRRARLHAVRSSQDKAPWLRASSRDRSNRA
jgi:hypothetical protein